MHLQPCINVTTASSACDLFIYLLLPVKILAWKATVCYMLSAHNSVQGSCLDWNDAGVLLLVPQSTFPVGRPHPPHPRPHC